MNNFPHQIGDTIKIYGHRYRINGYIKEIKEIMKGFVVSFSSCDIDFIYTVALPGRNQWAKCRGVNFYITRMVLVEKNYFR